MKNIGNKLAIRQMIYERLTDSKDRNKQQTVIAFCHCCNCCFAFLPSLLKQKSFVETKLFEYAIMYEQI